MKPLFNIIAKPIGSLCNLDCSYCFYLEKEKLYAGSNKFRMNEKVLESYIRQFIETHGGSTVDFVWQGGEPTLLGVDYFKKVVSLQRKYADGKTIRNAFQTNGVLLNDEWCAFFKEHDFLIGLSIDGPEEIHNRYRITKGGSGSFKQVMRGLEYLKKHEVEFNTLTCVQRDNSYKALQVYRFLKEIGSQFMQFIPIVERIGNQPDSSGLLLLAPQSKEKDRVTEWSVEALQYGIFLQEIFDEWVRNDVGKHFIRIFDNALQAWYGMQANLCVFRETCGDALAIEHNGDLYSCDHYVFPDYKLGNILQTPLAELIRSPQQIRFGMDKQDTLPQYCLDCSYRFICNGGCPKDRFIKTPAGEDGLHYLCAGYKHIFSHIDLYMRFMADELKHKRPPANVMQWAKEKDAGFPSLKVKPNDRCPCGSGKKYKFCCGKKEVPIL